MVAPLGIQRLSGGMRGRHWTGVDWKAAHKAVATTMAATTSMIFDFRRSSLT